MIQWGSYCSLHIVPWRTFITLATTSRFLLLVSVVTTVISPYANLYTSKYFALILCYTSQSLSFVLAPLALAFPSAGVQQPVQPIYAKSPLEPSNNIISAYYGDQDLQEHTHDYSAARRLPRSHLPASALRGTRLPDIEEQAYRQLDGIVHPPVWGFHIVSGLLRCLLLAAIPRSRSQNPPLCRLHHKGVLCHQLRC